jgi:hypothetical protein
MCWTETISLPIPASYIRSLPTPRVTIDHHLYENIQHTINFYAPIKLIFVFITIIFSTSVHLVRTADLNL